MMSRYIDADELTKEPWFVEIHGETIDDIAEQIIKACKYIVKSAPSIDIVRCKECKYSSDDGTYGCMSDHFNGLDDVYHRMYADDFCSYGERAEQTEPETDCSWR